MKTPQPTSKGGVLSGALLVGGTSVGAGMLAMPVVTGEMGFIPAMIINVVCWLFMMATGLLFLEVTLWMDRGAHIFSMAKRFLGRPGEIVGVTTFLFLYNCLLVGYFAAGEPLFVDVIRDAFAQPLSPFMGHFLFLLVFGGIVYLGTSVLDRINWILMVGLITSYLMLVTLGAGEVQARLLERANWRIILFAAPTLFGAYGYHNIIPSLTLYLNKNAKALRWSIIIGTTIPFVAYSLWQWIILGAIPNALLAENFQLGEPVTAALMALQLVTNSPTVSWLGMYFSFFALVTSLLGVSLSMVDFLADGLGLKRSPRLQRLFLCLLTFVPPMIFAELRPGLFIEAMGIAGGFGEALLNGCLPVAMVWVGRYHMGLTSEVRLPGGKPVLVLLLIITFAVMGIELHHLIYS